MVEHPAAPDIQDSGEQTPIGTGRKRVDAEATRLVGLGATITGALSEEGLDHYAVGMKDPEDKIRYQLTAAAEARITYGLRALAKQVAKSICGLDHAVLGAVSRARRCVTGSRQLYCAAARFS